MPPHPAPDAPPPAAPPRALRSLATEVTRRAAGIGAGAAMLGAGLGAWSATRELTNGALLGVALGGAAAAGALGAVLARGWLRSGVERPLAGIAATLDQDSGEAPGAPSELPPRELTILADRVRDTVERLRAEQAQRGRAEKLATVGRMAAGIAHEVGNPLGAINGYAHVLRLRTTGVAEAAPVLDALERETDRIERIVGGLLDFARPRRITPASVNVNDVMSGAVRLLVEQGVLRRITVRAEWDRHRPTVFAERHELEQVFVNLLLNAADAIDGGPGTVALITRQATVDELGHAAQRRAGDPAGVLVPPRRNQRVTEWLSGAAHAPRAVAQVVVADSGPGIPPSDWERVFDPFYTTKEAGRGTGLGLAIVARTVEQLGGAVWVQRAREGGAAFVMLIPLADDRTGVPAVRPGLARPAEQLALPLRLGGVRVPEPRGSDARHDGRDDGRTS